MKAGLDYMAALFHKYDERSNGRTMPEVSVRDALRTIGGLTVENNGKMISQHGNEDWF